MLPIFERFAGICEGYIRQGKTRQTLTEDEIRNVRYLATVMIQINEICRVALA